MLVCQDNGVKIVDSLGEMLARDWEKFAIQMANARSEVNCAFSVLPGLYVG